VLEGEASVVRRATEIWPVFFRTQPAKKTSNRASLARNRGSRPLSYSRWARVIGSTWDTWFAATTQPASAGSLSASIHSCRVNVTSSGFRIPIPVHHATLRRSRILRGLPNVLSSSCRLEDEITARRLRDRGDDLKGSGRCTASSFP
jgi:hypothetical protein